MTSVGLASVATVADVTTRQGLFDVYRAAIGFIDELAEAPREETADAIAEEPRLTGEPRVDALLAAVAEHLAFHHRVAAPLWCLDPSRRVAAAWFPIDLLSLRVRGLVTSPASFARRGIYIDRADLDRV